MRDLVHQLVKGCVDTGIDELAEAAADPRLRKSERTEAADFLREFLRERPINAVYVLQQAKKLGFTEITIRRAKKDLGVTSFRDPQFPGFWMWRLSDTPNRPSKSGHRRVTKRS